MKSVAEQVALAREAQKVVASYNQEQIDEVCLAVGWEMYKDDNIEKLAKMAVEETGFGNVESKIIKHKRKVGGVMHDIRGAVSVGLIERDEANGISKYAKPVGVVCAILPATNPTATCGGKAVSILKGRNAVIFKASSRAVKATAEAVRMMREGLKKVGAPVDLIQLLEDGSREGITELMRLSDLVVATGSGAVVKAAYSSGTPAYGVGQGNAVAIIAEDADVPTAAEMIFRSKTFDNATSCSSENAAIAVESVYDQFLDELVKNKSYIVRGEDRDKLEKHMWKVNAKGKLALNPDIIAKSAAVIAEGAGINIPEGTEMLIVEGREPIKEDKFHDEKISPVLTVYKTKDFDDSYRLLTELTDIVGPGHSCGIHTKNRDYINFLGENMKSSRVTVNQPMSAGNGGHAYNRMPSTATLGCGTWGGNITTENIWMKHFLNITWVNEPVEPWSYTDEEIWGDFWQRHGK
ncbi:MAG: aldehyde dehydrogenase family protein [Desulfovibrio sp.]|nr:aldehyde dehydrogenase family protein [Desulfovibrio sp.]